VADEDGGGWGFYPIVKQTVTALPGRPRHRMLGQRQTSGTVQMACRSCPAKPARRVWKLGNDAENAEKRGMSIIWV
jgi:hypothetical protein